MDFVSQNTVQYESNFSNSSLHHCALWTEKFGKIENLDFALRYQAKRHFFCTDTGQKASESDPREAFELNLGQKFHQDDAMLMVSARVDVDESTLPRRKQYHCKSAFGATSVDRSGSSARLDFAPDRLAIT